MAAAKIENYLKEVVDGKRDNLLDSISLLILNLLEQIYKILLFFRKKLYRFINKSKLTPVVISIGNITVGGTGKTPVVNYLARRLDSKGISSAIISRGYGSGTEGPLIVSDGCDKIASYKETGDEALMLSKLLEGFPVVIGKKRVVAGRLAQDEFNPDVILMDDGFQHWRLVRDVDIVVIDGLNPFGNKHLLPRGYLREPLTALKRGDIFIITRADLLDEIDLTKIKEEIRLYNKTTPIFTAGYKPSYLRLLDIEGKSSMDLIKSYNGDKVLAFSGIGNPVSFHHTLSKNGFKVVDMIEFPDHYRYQESDFNNIAGRASEKGVKLVVTTEKDAVKFTDNMIKKLKLQSIELAVLGIELEIDRGDELLATLIKGGTDYEDNSDNSG